MVDKTPKYSDMMDGFDVVSRAAVDYESTPILPSPKGLEPIYLDDHDCGAYVVQSFIPVSGWFPFPITMTVYRSPSDGSVTLFNSFRVPAEVEDAILALGPVRNVVKLGQFHGQFDPYYIRSSKFDSPKYWAAEGATISKGLKIDTLLTEKSICSIHETAELYILPGMPFIECLVTVPVPNYGRLLIAVETFMHMYSSSGTGLFGWFGMNWYGFICEKNVPDPGPLWTTMALNICGKDTFESWFKHIDSMKWNSVVSGHGSAVVNVDKAKMAEARAKRVVSMAKKVLPRIVPE